MLVDNVVKFGKYKDLGSTYRELINSGDPKKKGWCEWLASSPPTNPKFSQQHQKLGSEIMALINSGNTQVGNVQDVTPSASPEAILAESIKQTGILTQIRDILHKPTEKTEEVDWDE